MDQSSGIEMAGWTSEEGGWGVVSEVSDSMFLSSSLDLGIVPVERGHWVEEGNVMQEDKERHSLGWKPLTRPARRDITEGKKMGMINSTHQSPSSSPSPSSPSAPQTE